jgi:HAD superfamily hydrolase (TIGR01509 family)
VIDAIVFDMDGVLVDSELVWDAARRGVVTDAGGRWTPTATTDMLGMNAPEWSRYLRDELGVPLEPATINDLVMERLLASYERELPLIPGAVAAVRRLAARWPLGIASSSNRPVIDAVLRKAGIAECFAATVAGEEIGRGKPAPDVYLAATRKLGVEPTRAAAIEDSTNGLRAAAAAGLFVIAVPNRDFVPSAEALSLAGLTAGSLDELTPDSILEAAG